MRIVHVVTYVSRDGSFGGPTAVALAQLSSLAKQGHEVELVSAWDGHEVLEVPGVKVNLFKARKLWPGFTGIIAPSLILYLIKSLDRETAFHIHLGRDLVTLGAATIGLLKSISYVVQTHGMVMPSTKKLTKILDQILTRRVLTSANKVLVLTKVEERGVSQVKRSCDGIVQIPNGISTMDTTEIVRDERTILFLARLHPRKRVLAFVEMCSLLANEGVAFQAYVIGPDEGDLEPLQRAIKRMNLSDYVIYEGSIRQGSSIERLAQAGIFVLPSFGEVFPMTVLESLAAKTPVVTTSQSGLASQLSFLKAAIITDGSPQELMASVKEILNNRDKRDMLVLNGVKAIENEFSIATITQKLEVIYSNSKSNSKKKA